MIHPWERAEKKYKQSCRIYYGRPKSFECIAIEQQIDDSPFQDWRKGDIIKFDDCLRPQYSEHWSDWFAQGRDARRFWYKIPNIPRYASNRFAMVVGRLRKIKYKYKTFRDYCVITMMLTGPNAGHIRRWWNRPFKLKCQYPSKIKFKYMLNTIDSEVIDIYNRDREDDSNEIRNQLCHEIYRVYHGE